MMKDKAKRAVKRLALEAAIMVVKYLRKRVERKK